MKQLVAAPSVLASSAGVSPDERAAALAQTSYAPPPARPADAEGPLPVRLALIATPAAGRVLAHVAPRPGGYVAHALLNVPPTADAQTAIQTWGSPLWQRSDPDTPADLPDLPYLPVADVLDDGILSKWLDAPAHRDLLEFTLAALLGVPAGGRVFLAAPADDVAKVVYAVTRALPPGLLDDFTFSTYESDPLAAPARLVGFESGSPDADLPDACYAAPNAAMNDATGRRTELTVAVPFAAFAVQALTEGGAAAKLDEVKATWQRLGMTEAKHFDLVYRMTRGTGVLEKDEAAEALQLPAVAAWISTRADALNQFLDWAIDDRAFATNSFSRAVQALRQKPDLVAKLAQTVRDAGRKALKAGDADRTATALEVILPMVAPAKAAGVWGELLGSIPDPDDLPWPMRWYLLPRFVRFKQQAGAGVDPAFTRWLAVPPNRLGELLGLDLPRAYQVAAGRATLARPDEPSAELARVLGSHPRLALTLLRADAGGEDRAVKLFDALLAEVPGRAWVEDLLGASSDYPPDLLHRFFEAALAAGKIDADKVARAHGEKLLDLFPGKPGLERFGTLFLSAPPADLLHHPGLLDFLAGLRKTGELSDDLGRRVDAVRAVKAYLDAPTFDPAAMTPAADALTMTPPVVPPTAKGEVFAAVSRELDKKADDDAVQADLEAALVHFGSALANDPADLFENLLRDLRGRYDVGSSPALVSGFLAVALGATKSEKLEGKLDDLDGPAFALAAEAAKRGGTRGLAEVGRRAEAWPKDAKTKWGFLEAAVRPRGRFRRDVVAFLLGAAVATAGWWAYRAYG